MITHYSALNTMFRKTPYNLTSFVSPKGKEKQIDYILTKRIDLRNVKDVEVNDMIHMGSDHRCIMATFLINTSGKNTHASRENKKEHEQKARTPILKCPSSKKDINKSLTQSKKPPPKKEMKYMTQKITRKIKSKEKTPQQQQKQKAHLLTL